MGITFHASVLSLFILVILAVVINSLINIKWTSEKRKEIYRMAFAMFIWFVFPVNFFINAMLIHQQSFFAAMVFVVLCIATIYPAGQCLDWAFLKSHRVLK